MKEFRDLKHFLGLDVECTKDGIFLGQQKYIKYHVQRYNMLWLYAYFNSYSRHEAWNDEKKNLKVVTMYHKIVESYLSYNNTTKKAYSIGVASRYMSNPKNSQMDEVMCVLRYVNGTINLGIIYRREYNT